MRRSGMSLALLLIVALIVAWLVMRQMGGNASASQTADTGGYSDLVDQAQNAVDAINGRITIPEE